MPDTTTRTTEVTIVLTIEERGAPAGLEPLGARVEEALTGFAITPDNHADLGDWWVKSATVTSGYCAWCEEAQSPVYLAHEGHDPECPFQ